MAKLIDFPTSQMFAEYYEQTGMMNNDDSIDYRVADVWSPSYQSRKRKEEPEIWRLETRLAELNDQVAFLQKQIANLAVLMADMARTQPLQSTEEPAATAETPANYRTLRYTL